MPEISRFYGIIIAVFHDEHNPPHFHARYGEFKAAIDIRSLSLLEGCLPGRALGLVIEWASQHQEELLRDWQLAASGQTPKKIEPLK
jgi:phosphomannomutase